MNYYQVGDGTVTSAMLVTFAILIGGILHILGWIAGYPMLVNLFR